MNRLDTGANIFDQLQAALSGKSQIDDHEAGWESGIASMASATLPTSAQTARSFSCLINSARPRRRIGCPSQAGFFF